MQQVTLGADPEFFICNKEGFVPVCGLIGGTKDSPIPIPKMKEGFTMQEDGAAAEINIPPQVTAEGFADATYKAVNTLRNLLIYKGYDVMKECSVLLDPKHVEKFPSLSVIGCDPDYDAYVIGATGVPDKRQAPRIGLNRGAAGHIHVGYNTKTIPEHIAAKFLDLLITVPMLRIDVQGTRRSFYGLPGLYRPKPYGIEYRTPSNYWVGKLELTQRMGQTIINFFENVQQDIVTWQAIYNQVHWDNVKQVVVAYDTDKRYMSKMYRAPILEQLKAHKILWGVCGELVDYCEAYEL